MSSHLDLEEQEQLDQIKHFWNKWGTPITAVLLAASVTFAGWNGWQYWQQRQASLAAALADTVTQAIRSNDQPRIQTALADLQRQFPSTLQASIATLQAAKTAQDAGQTDTARTALQWVSEHASHPGYQAIARLRLAAVLMQDGKVDDAITLLRGNFPDEFKPLAADRLGDALQLQGKTAEAITAYETAWKHMGTTSRATATMHTQYRSLVGFKLNALGVATPETQTQ